MHLPIPAGPRRRTRRAVLAAALPAVLAAAALPSAAQAGFVDRFSDGTLHYQDDSGFGTSSSVIVSGRSSAPRVADTAGLQVGPGCTRISSTEASCQASNRLQAFLGAGSDVFRSDVSGLPTFVDGGIGNDVYVRGLGGGISRVDFRGGTGIDRAEYVLSDSGVLVSKDERANDGRPELDGDNIRGDVEHLLGSQHGDSLNGGNATDIIEGFTGDDLLFGSGGDDQFRSSASADGADQIIGGGDFDRVSYAQRTRPVTVNLSAGGADDGETGEGDEIREIEMADGGKAGDALMADRTLTGGVTLNGGGGIDTITGTDQADRLQGNPGRDIILALRGDDRIAARDNETDEINCGIGTDTVSADANLELMANCETVDVGRLRLSPTAIEAQANEITRLRLSWRHPRAWRRLRTIELRLTQDGVPVGEVTIRPKAKRITPDGALKLVRKASRLTRNGKTVTARLALRLDDSLAGQTLTAEVEATDTRGRRQLETNAGTLRVAE